jgi:group I intron endonuclease
MIIYKTTNLVNGKIYIGQHNGATKSYIGSGVIFKKAVKKYGKENFVRDVIVDGNYTQEETDELEVFYIKLYNSTDKSIGYNISLGGNGAGKISEETKIKIGDANRGRIHSKEFKDKISEIKKGGKRKDSTKSKISKSTLGVKKSESHRLNISKAKEIKVYRYSLIYGILIF